MTDKRDWMLEQMKSQVDQNREDEDNSLPKLKRETETVPFTVGEVKPREIGSLDEDDGRISQAQSDEQPRDTKSLPPMICAADGEHFYGPGAAKAALLHMQTEHNDPDLEANTDTASLPSSRPMTLRQQLAAIEHERWASWQQWVFDMYGTYNDDGSFTISAARVANMQRQIDLPYSELTPKEQESDLKEVDRYWPLIEQYCQEIAREARLDEVLRLDKLVSLKLSENDDMGLREYPHRVYKIIQSRLAGLTSPDTTAAGNDLPSYDPKADIEATLRRKGQLTQKPPQEEPK